jgi:L-fuculose-phosphate aldolase
MDSRFGGGHVPPSRDQGQLPWDREQSLREEMVSLGRLMYERGYVVANDGNLSARLDDEHVLCTPSGLCKAMMTTEQMIVVDMEGHKVGRVTAANRDLVPTSEVFMHLEVYRQRHDVQAVVHAHPPTTVALSIAGISLADCMLPEVIVKLGLVPTTQYATPGSIENVAAIRDLIVTHDGIILQRHGAIAAGPCLLEAYMRLEAIEHIAKITVVLEQLGRGEPLPPDQVEKLLAQRRKMGLARPGENEAFCRVCGVCDSAGQLEPLMERTEACPQTDGSENLVRLVTQAVMRELGYTN